MMGRSTIVMFQERLLYFFISRFIMDTANKYLTDIDVMLATLSTSTASCDDLKHNLRKVVRKYKDNSEDIVDATRYVWDCISHENSDSIPVSSLRRDIAGVRCKNGNVTRSSVSEDIPRGFVIPRFYVRRRDVYSMGWIRHPTHGWLAPAGNGHENVHRSGGHRRTSPRNGMIFCGIVLCMIGVLLYMKRKRLAHVVAQYQSIDEQFIDAPPPTHLRVESQSMEPMMTPAMMMPSTTDLVQDFRQIAGTSLASSTAKLYS
jgi:hypothetical protein